jgi:hypothetical protein
MTEPTIVKQVLVSITDIQLQTFIDQINQDLADEDGDLFDEDDGLLTITEVVGNQKLLDYICESAVEDGTAVYDPEEFWNNDGWCDWSDFR